MSEQFNVGQTIYYFDRNDDGARCIEKSEILRSSVEIEDGEDGDYPVTVYEILYSDGVNTTWLQECQLYTSEQDAFKQLLKAER